MVLDLVARGQVGRAAARIKSRGVASMDTPGVKEALRTKFPARPALTKLSYFEKS